MNITPFPTSPTDVVALTVQEFMFDRDMNYPPSLDVVCRNFAGDTNRAVVWLIRFRALKAWCARSDMAAWLEAGGGTATDACEAAASFELNDRWEFDAAGFRSAVGVLVRHRA